MGDHFRDRLGDQRWVVYDVGRLVDGRLDEELMDKDERLFQQLWKTYFKAICIKERWNPRKHRQDMPVRYWKYLTEKQE